MLETGLQGEVHKELTNSFYLINRSMKQNSRTWMKRAVSNTRDFGQGCMSELRYIHHSHAVCHLSACACLGKRTFVTSSCFPQAMQLRIFFLILAIAFLVCWNLKTVFLSWWDRRLFINTRVDAAERRIVGKLAVHFIPASQKTWWYQL